MTYMDTRILRVVRMGVRPVLARAGTVVSVAVVPRVPFNC